MATVLSPQRPLGSTGVTVPLIGYGTAPLGKEKVSRELAVRCLNHAIDKAVSIRQRAEPCFRRRGLWRNAQNGASARRGGSRVPDLLGTRAGPFALWRTGAVVRQVHRAHLTARRSGESMLQEVGGMRLDLLAND